MSELRADADAPRRLHLAVVLRVAESSCEVWSAGGDARVRFAPHFPSPRSERVSAGHLVAVATAPDGADVIVWRWYDAVVLGHDLNAEGDPVSVRLWEPSHGEVLATPRSSYQQQLSGSRAYLSAGLPGADWWVAGCVVPHPEAADVELDAVHSLYTDNNLWAATFAADS